VASLPAVAPPGAREGRPAVAGLPDGSASAKAGTGARKPRRSEMAWPAAGCPPSRPVGSAGRLRPGAGASGGRGAAVAGPRAAPAGRHLGPTQPSPDGPAGGASALEWSMVGEVRRPARRSGAPRPPEKGRGNLDSSDTRWLPGEATKHHVDHRHIDHRLTGLV